MLFLPETLHQRLPETLREAEQFGKKQRFWYIPQREVIDVSDEDRYLSEKLNGPEDERN